MNCSAQLSHRADAVTGVGDGDKRNGQWKWLLPSPDKAEAEAGTPLKTPGVGAAERVNVDTGQQAGL